MATVTVKKLPECLELTEDGYLRFRGHRIHLEHVLELYTDGYSAEMIAAEYPTLGLAAVHHAIAFYLENRAAIDEYLSRVRRENEQRRQEGPTAPTANELRQRLPKTGGES